MKAQALDGVLPPQRSDVAGAMVGIAGFKRPDCGNNILPGAFCDHLTSYARVTTGGRPDVLSDRIRYGAAGAAGTVDRALRHPGEVPHALRPLLRRGRLLPAEASYQSVRAPNQQLLVDEPLCQPWARPPGASHDGPGGRVRR